MILLHRCQHCGSLAVRDLDGIHLCDSMNCEAAVMKCRGFQWIGQSLEQCNGCGAPYWEHAHMEEFDRDKGPFDEDCWLYEPISEGAKVRMKAKYKGRQ